MKSEPSRTRVTVQNMDFEREDRLHFDVPITIEEQTLYGTYVIKTFEEQSTDEDILLSITPPERNGKSIHVPGSDVVEAFQEGVLRQSR